MAPRGVWIPDAQLLELLREGLTYEEIAERNWLLTGYRPSRGRVSYHARRLGFVSPYYGRNELVPEDWHPIKKEHREHRLYKMLGAESRRRELSRKDKPYSEMSRTDGKWLRAMARELFGEDGEMLRVIDYDPETEEGFFLTPATPDDVVIVRRPKPSPQPEDQ